MKTIIEETHVSFVLKNQNTVVVRFAEVSCNVKNNIEKMFLELVK